MRSTLLAIAVIGIISTPGLAQTYLCTEDAASGFSQNEQTKQWEPSRFKADSRYVIRKNDAKWEMSTLGSTLVKSCMMSLDTKFIECGLLIKFIMSTETMRYQVNTVVFTTIMKPGEPSSNSSVYIEIGRCAPI